MGIKELVSDDLYVQALTEDFEYSSTKTIEPIDEIVGQERAQKAVEFAMSIKEKGYNIYAIGRNGLGKRTMVLRYLNRHPVDNESTFDWCYVANFEDIRTPKVLKLPAGVGSRLSKDIEKLMTKLVKAMPLAFDNEIYYSRADKLKNQLAAKQQTELEGISKEAKERGISLTITNQGDYQFVAMNGEDLHTEESFDELTLKEQDYFDKTIDSLEISLRSMVRQLTEWEEAYTEKIHKLNSEVTLDVISHFIKQLKKDYSDFSEVKKYLSELQKDIIENVDIFLEEANEHGEVSTAALDKKLPRRYKINVLVSQKDENFPIIVEDNPNYHSLFGYTETATFKGTVFTDFSLIRPGSLHKANGGVLLMDAVKVLEQPYVWDGLKRALRARQLSLTSLEKELTLTGAVSLDPEPIPLDVKIILFGDYRTYQLLQHYDAEFGELFRVTADFEDEMTRTPEAELHYARFISSIVHDNGMLHCDKKAIARIIEHSSRRAGDCTKLSLHSAHIANLLRESNYVARAAKSNLIRSSHVEQALASQEMRVGRLKDSVMESFTNGTTLIKTEGEAVGQVNALSVLSTSDHMFGAPNRISATTAYGDGEVIDIERNVDLGGNIHSKGVMILSAYLASVFGKTARVPLTTHITFEQSYGGVDGDSASMAELCAIVSAFSKLPNRQDIAITGSMNQFGESQPIGGVNEKIEGFFDVCVIKGRNSSQGVIIPQANVHNLMLRADIVEAVEKGEFHIWAIEHVTEAIEIFTGKKPGDLGDEGAYPIDSVFGIAQAKLNALRK
ncbi:putative ATP-dependent protease [Vibrio nigripulchritudo MADA3029]|uniref:endopeptidase La n=2 Tax=Vibrio nigripulchritudo TaxID=28173 RepID=U4K8H7_9VIBR|nr:ATP-binding protein [Vibrio nigripulchritudo]KJY78636.1 ATP-dependent protease [Vibrio nigripulchritudo]CCN47675.1 putative ATP-dependent protease [Vibrio nigripulchritudo MADA3020]CCN55161.1 putative ATP-dependent protease [Vibrio nigripulchritudo MADA3021]CCN58742.1 putative ATP-dependent protease [Vibrio nigripulchritudo MADA3029]CCN81027.1 putative ATP-dependent protease [Vibrio nigripulchritudo BLFn1]